MVELWTTHKVDTGSNPVKNLAFLPLNLDTINTGLNQIVEIVGGRTDNLLHFN